jgi:hypothetical protein
LGDIGSSSETWVHGVPSKCGRGRAAGQDHDEVLTLLGEAGVDGAAVAKELARLLPIKTKAEYEADDVSKSAAAMAVARAHRCVAVARRVVAARPRVSP